MLLPRITRGCRANRVNSCSGVRVAPLCRSVMLPKLATSLAGAFTGAWLQAPSANAANKIRYLIMLPHYRKWRHYR